MREKKNSYPSMVRKRGGEWTREKIRGNIYNIYLGELRAAGSENGSLSLQDVQI